MSILNNLEKISGLIERAQRNANHHNFDSRLTFKHSALLVDGNKIIATGFNSLHTIGLRGNPTLARLSGRAENENHAEVSVIHQGCRKHNVKGMDIVVVRVGSRGDLAMSRPCHLCQRVMREHGIRRAFYSIAPGEFGVMKF